MEDAEFDHHAQRYDEELAQGLRLTGEGKEFFAEGRVTWMRRRWLKAPWTANSILDFGCGTGGSCDPLGREFGGSYVGVDPSMASLEEARRLYNGSGATFFTESGKVEDSTMDLAFTNGVFHHIPPDQRAACLREIWRTLTPGGRFAFWENNRWNPIVHWVMARVPFDADAQMLFPFQARAMLREAGFEIEGTDFAFVFPAALKGLRWLEPLLAKLPFGGQYLVIARKPKGTANCDQNGNC
ncbi:MAG: class I SAM-dependent methyltransferase [Verrucomicrobiales bacterium]|nr:class I SAM-dependent methyltransferase [Verrucomicrobiales bacterium]